MTRLGVVVIGRNEGERLRTCLTSLRAGGAPVIYVDSGSTDGSLAAAESLGACCVALDPRTPFTAARARNAGFERLLADHPRVALVQFVDGDCEVVPGWLERAALELERDPALAVVYGRRRERYPARSLYNRVADVEWNLPVGPSDTCGGDAMMRASALRAVGGFDATLIAGEEPELCARLCARGWTVVRIDAEMTLHDAAMTHFRQWWRRALRTGHAYAERYAMHGIRARKNASVFVSGLLVPAAALAGAIPSGGASLVLPVALWSAQALRSYRGSVRRGIAHGDAWRHALLAVLAAVPQAQGQLKYLVTRVRGRRSGLIEYKGAAGE
jgi:GT2 family glycosyltransferase